MNEEVQRKMVRALFELESDRRPRYIYLILVLLELSWASYGIQYHSQSFLETAVDFHARDFSTAERLTGRMQCECLLFSRFGRVPHRRRRS